MTPPFLQLALLTGYMVAVVVGAMGAIIVFKMARGTIDLSMLVAENDGSASLSRFQFLVFTFVIAVSLLLLVLANIERKVFEFPAINSGVLTLLGISGGSYVVSKGIQKNFEVADKQADTANLTATAAVAANTADAVANVAATTGKIWPPA
jgi:hypothetical protein